MRKEQTIAVVIPCYKVMNQILWVIDRIGPEVQKIYVVDDACPDNTGDFVEQNCDDPRLRLIRNQKNLGVGGAVMAGYKAAIADNVEIVVKIDGDGQMDPVNISEFVDPIISGEADYTKGNRFFDLEGISMMPMPRLFGNAVLSFMSKLSTGYWTLFDPTNGYTAIHIDVAKHLPFEKISKRYFFETDMLFRLNILRAVVIDIPMEVKYGGEVSNLKIANAIGEFAYKHAKNFIKRVFYNYYLRDMSVASFELPGGLALFVFGGVYGLYHWVQSAKLGVATSAGTVMLAALPVILGLQFLLSFLAQDIRSVPIRPIHRKNKNR